jgi:tetratricopeptide (TPR) repeat protein
MAGLQLASEKKYGEAIAHYQAALKANPESAAAESDWGLALIQQGRWQECIPHYEQALRLDPTLAEAHRNLALAYYQHGLELEHQGQIIDAVNQYTAAVGQNPDLAEALQHLAWIAATDARPELRNGSRAVEMAARACALTGQKRPSMLLTLAAAYAESGRFAEALATVDKAEAVSRSQGQKELEPEAARMRAAFAAGQPLHQP